MLYQPHDDRIFNQNSFVFDNLYITDYHNFPVILTLLVNICRHLSFFPKSSLMISRSPKRTLSAETTFELKNNRNTSLCAVLAQIRWRQLMETSKDINGSTIKEKRN